MVKDTERERLVLLAEECAEITQIVCKILRHGYNSTHPDSIITNRELLEKEIADVTVAIKLLLQEYDITESNIKEHMTSKQESVNMYLHFNQVNTGC